ncbi:MAG: hypothetical protein ACOYOO_04105 [Saprospiraceae bacterium]|jgi:hypothetical protein
MSKKKFNEGLESLFVEMEQEASAAKSALLESSDAGGRGPASGKEGGTAAQKRPVGKKFGEDMDSFLKNAFEESFERQMRSDFSQTDEAAIKRRSHRPVGGLDALIRNTVQPQEVHFDENATRRLTLVFDEQKLKKLREIARQEKTYLKDIIDEIVAEFIQSYEKKKKKS